MGGRPTLPDEADLTGRFAHGQEVLETAEPTTEHGGRYTLSRTLGSGDGGALENVQIEVPPSRDTDVRDTLDPFFRRVVRRLLVYFKQVLLTENFSPKLSFGHLVSEESRGEFGK